MLKKHHFIRTKVGRKTKRVIAEIPLKTQVCTQRSSVAIGLGIFVDSSRGIAAIRSFAVLYVARSFLIQVRRRYYA